MSRCVQFPPPGYVLPPAYILQDGYILPPGYVLKEIGGFKKVVKKHKNKKRKNGVDHRSNKEHRRKRRRKDETKIASEKSCVTVELETQTTSQNSCESILRTNESSTGNSYSTPANEATQRDHALRVSQEKLRDPIFGSSVGITSKHNKEKKLSLSTQQEKPSASHQENVGPSKQLLCSKCPPSVALDYLNLIENWAPPTGVGSKLTDSEDQEWWMVSKSGSKRQNEVSSNERISEGSSSMKWPRAQYLPEAQVYALPFTVPF